MSKIVIPIGPVTTSPVRKLFRKVRIIDLDGFGSSSRESDIDKIYLILIDLKTDASLILSTVFLNIALLTVFNASHISFVKCWSQNVIIYLYGKMFDEW